MQNNMNHIEFPIPSKPDAQISGYLKNFTDGSYKLHCIQRNDSTWKPEEYRKTIQSIFSNILISPFVGSIQPDGVTTHLLDGGHRTLAMQRFVGNEFEVCAPSTGQMTYYKDLPAIDRKNFDDLYTIPTVIYKNLTNEQEELLFFRLNIGVPLSAGEAVRAHRSIPICALASELADEYIGSITEQVGNVIKANNVRADASSWMLLILENFHAGEIVISQNPTADSKQPENVNRCEKYRSTQINEQCLRKQTASLMEVLKGKSIQPKFRAFVIPSVQGIMMKYPTMTCTVINQYLSEMLNYTKKGKKNEKNDEKDVDKSDERTVHNTDWDRLEAIGNAPGEKSKCQARVRIFGRWFEDQRLV
tara:strand:+ start:366 stop:1448 length:1083 start_codon:yes stop_codon:yes gene_type:complete